MEAATVPQTEKRLYRNHTAGYLGVVQLNHANEEVGVNVDPGGTIWLSEAEAILTARAPRRPEDNPFEEQTFFVTDAENGQRRELRFRPLTLEDDDGRPSERYVPTQVELTGRDKATADAPPPVPASPPVRTTPPTRVDDAAAVPGSTGSTQPQAPPPPAPVAPASPQAVAPPVRQEPRPTPPPAPQSDLVGSPVGPPADGPEGDEAALASWTNPPEAPGRVLTAPLGGSDEPAPEVTAAAAPDPTQPQPGDRAVAPPAAVPQTVGAMEEEHAAVDPAIGEETGAARPPTQPQPVGEFAQAEEVGSPDAPASNAGTEAGQ